VRRLLLISNGNAYRTTAYQREVIPRALAAEFKVDVSVTTRPGDATLLARQAALDGIAIVAALGGDGTVNEVANGLAGTDSSLAILPAGMANVFARSLGIPDDPIEATGWLVENPDVSPRRVPLGLVADRHFTVSCGVGLDAAIVREVERRQWTKKRVGDWFFVWSGLRVFFRGYDRRKPHIDAAWGPELEERRAGLFLAIAQNTTPYTYFRGRAMRLCPDAEMDGGLDLLALDSLRTRVAIPVVARAFRSARHIRGRHALYVKDRRRFDLRCDRPMPVQVDGEFIGLHERLAIESVPAALGVLF
jgi:diacylglycerol kinase family enzyme